MHNPHKNIMIISGAASREGPEPRPDRARTPGRRAARCCARSTVTHATLLCGFLLLCMVGTVWLVPGLA
jgi:hypothetical protein